MPSAYIDGAGHDFANSTAADNMHICIPAVHEQRIWPQGKDALGHGRLTSQSRKQTHKGHGGKGAGGGELLLEKRPQQVVFPHFGRVGGEPLRSERPHVICDHLHAA